jgi:hypothetical protein
MAIATKAITHIVYIRSVSNVWIVIEIFKIEFFVIFLLLAKNNIILLC